MSTNKPTVFLDMDGVLVDFFGAFAKLANVEHWKEMDAQRLQGLNFRKPMPAIVL